MTSPPPPLSGRARGALLGLAVGDALGAPLVGMGREQARIKHGVVTEYLGGGLHLLAPGANTARVALARAAAVALLEPAPHDERLRAGYLAVLVSGAPGLGEATRAALERLRDGEPANEAPRSAHEALERRTAGAGPALRCVPYAVRHAHRPEELEEAVLRDAAMTHFDPAAGAAALGLALWVREHVAGEDDPAGALARVRERLALRPELPDVLPAEAAVRRLGVRPTAYAPDVLHAVARHVLSARAARPALVGAVNEAGQAAVLGAAAGALLGARFGEEGLPERWTALLAGASAWRALADRLLAAGA